MSTSYYTRKSGIGCTSNSTPVYIGSKIVGAVQGDVFRKTIAGSKHLLRKPLAIAISTDALSQAERFGATRIEVFDREAKVMYCSTIAHLREGGFALDRGFGRQVALPLTGWVSSKPDDVTQPGLFQDWG